MIHPNQTSQSKVAPTLRASRLTLAISKSDLMTEDPPIWTKSGPSRRNLQNFINFNGGSTEIAPNTLDLLPSGWLRQKLYKNFAILWPPQVGNQAKVGFWPGHRLAFPKVAPPLGLASPGQMKVTPVASPDVEARLSLLYFLSPAGGVAVSIATPPSWLILGRAVTSLDDIRPRRRKNEFLLLGLMPSL